MRFPKGVLKKRPTPGNVEVAHSVVSILRSETRDGCR